MTTRNPHRQVREDWLALTQEDILAPEQPIFDAHHHLWDRPESRYRADDFQLDVMQGHNVRASLFVQCRTGYRTDGPDELKPVGEVKTVLDWCKAYPTHPIGLVVFADLQLGAQVQPVLDAMLEAGGQKVRGVRNTTAYHVNPAISSNPLPAPDGLLRSEAFKEGAKAVSARGLPLDIWAYQTQLSEVCALARALPELTIVLDHCGGPLGLAPYDGSRSDALHDWQVALAQVAELPNTRIKIGGFGLAVMGFNYADQARPPSSTQLAIDWAPYFDTCLELFGTDRAMFESNFPVDKGQFGYRALWNTFKRLSEGFGHDSRNDLFWRTAAHCYGIEHHHFLHEDTWRH